MIISSQLLSDYTHGFFTRNGGVSEGIYSSLNCGFGSGDNQILVAENRQRAMRRLGLQSLKLITCSQVHGTEVLTIANKVVLGNPEKSDALVSDQVGVTIPGATQNLISYIDPFAGDDRATLGEAPSNTTMTITFIDIQTGAYTQATITVNADLIARTQRTSTGKEIGG